MRTKSHRSAPRNYTYYVEPIGSTANEVISRKCPPESERTGLTVIRLGDKAYRSDAFDCTEEFLIALRRTAVREGFSFRAYRQEGKGAIHEIARLSHSVAPSSSRVGVEF
jgi:hypothetical protein